MTLRTATPGGPPCDNPACGAPTLRCGDHLRCLKCGNAMGTESERTGERDALFAAMKDLYVELGLDFERSVSRHTSPEGWDHPYIHNIAFSSENGIIGVYLYREPRHDEKAIPKTWQGYPVRAAYWPRPAASKKGSSMPSIPWLADGDLLFRVEVAGDLVVMTVEMNDGRHFRKVVRRDALTPGMNASFVFETGEGYNVQGVTVEEYRGRAEARA